MAWLERATGVNCPLPGLITGNTNRGTLFKRLVVGFAGYYFD
jgi:hypothetical protein